MRGFNPLTGIRCFLTTARMDFVTDIGEPFQSPHGDSLFSDSTLATN